jgi:hypothetical protein
LPAAAGFLEGFGNALGSSNTTSVVSGNGSIITFESGKNGVSEGVYRGISDAAQTAGGFFRDQAAATKPLIRVATGTPMGLFFVNSMTDGTGNNGGVIESPVMNTQNGGIPSGPPLPPISNTVAPVLINPAGMTSNLGGSQSSLANSGLSVIQTTPK